MLRKLALTALPITLSVVAFGACETGGEQSSEDEDTAQGSSSLTEQDLFDCNDPGQRLTCGGPDNPSKRFVCHATGSSQNSYNKISVPLNNGSHVPGASHNANHAPDQAPGASGDDVGSGPGLDCDCEERVCDGVCTGGPEGAACDDGDLCTVDGSCSGDDCALGAPSCVAGAVIDECNIATGGCDASDGACERDPLSNGTPCGEGQICNSTGSCVEIPHVVLNEVESSGGVPGDWAELYNAGSSVADVSGWIFKDNNNANGYVIPAGTVIAVGGHLVLNEASFGFGLGSNDSARIFDANGALVDSHVWTSHALTTYGRCPNGSGAFVTTNSSTKGAANNCAVSVKINEVESSGGTPGDWAELYNPNLIPMNVSGWVFRDNNNANGYTIPAGTTMAAGAYLVLDEITNFNFGLGSNDSARLFDASGNLMDSYAWTSHATTTYGRCPNGTGAFATTVASTKGATNNCGGQPPQPPAAAAWPGGNNTVNAADAGNNVFGTNLSGLFYEASATDVLWAVRNGPETLYRLQWTGSVWAPEIGDGWDAGRMLRYPDGMGQPDAEDVTKADSSSAVYVVTERDNAASGVARHSILRYDSAAVGGDLVATNEWNLNADIGVVGANLGPEGITWIPDTFLVANGFIDENTGLAFNPASYPNHGTGLFFVGLEANGQIRAYALNHSGGFTRIAIIASGDAVVKALSFDRDVGYLWTTCGNTCGNQTGVLAIDTTVGSPTKGKFKLKKQYAPPTGMSPSIANEGIAIAPESQCVAGSKKFYWTDDGATGGISLRSGFIPCGAFIP